ncbi:hypothetical protein RJ55_04895 [Drechmeria coniospora]|nr:hypothetical protein RJ55_04895 [Drechmeria coniospora]
MASVPKWVRSLSRRAPLPPIQFPTAGFEIIDDTVLLEEEQLREFKTGQFYPVNIGEIFSSKHQVVGKLGYGTTSTVWLAKNLQDGNNRYVALKVYTRDHSRAKEFKVLEAIGKTNPAHPDHRHVRTALDLFQLHRSGGDHSCLDQRPMWEMWESWKDLLRRNESGRFTEDFLKAGLRHLFMALDYLHSECKLVHTGKCITRRRIAYTTSTIAWS